MKQLHVFLLSMIISIGGVVSQLEGGEFVLQKGNAGNTFVQLSNGFYLYVPEKNVEEGVTTEVEYFYHVGDAICKVIANPEATLVTLYKGDKDKEGVILPLSSTSTVNEDSINYLEPVNGITFSYMRRKKESKRSLNSSSLVYVSATEETGDESLLLADKGKNRYAHFTKTTPSYTFSDALVFFMVHTISKEIALHWLSHSGCSIKPIKYRSLHLINNQIAIAAAEGALWGGISVGSNSSSLTSSKVGDVILSALGNGAIALVQEWIRQPIEWYARKWCNNISLKTNQSSGGHYIAALLAKELLRQTIRSGLHIAVMMMVYGIHSYQCKIKMAHMGPWWDDKNVVINCAYYFFKKLGMVS